MNFIIYIIGTWHNSKEYFQDPYSKKKLDEQPSNINPKTMNKTLGDNSMTWKICCNNIGQNRTTFQSFLNVLEIREMSGKEVNEKGKSFYDTDLYG